MLAREASRGISVVIDSPGHGKPGPTSPARPGPKISGLGRVFWPDGRAWAAEMRPDSLLGPGLGSRFADFWEGPARKPDGPTEKSSFGPGLGRFFRPDSRAGPGLGSHFQFRALSRPSPTRPGPRGCPGIVIEDMVVFFIFCLGFLL
jgi:hypothetical protein